MTEREKVIKALQACYSADVKWCQARVKGQCDYNVAHCRMALFKDAAKMLEVQKPRVMTWQEVIGAALECKPVYIEVLDSEDKEPGDDRWAMVTQYKDSITNGMIRAMSSYITSEILFAEGYNKSWRCWTSKPSDAQMEAIPWE